MRIAKSSAIAASIPGVNALEPISPELVLVDPELARVARARLPDRETAGPDLETTVRPVGPLRERQEPEAQMPQAPRVESPPISQRPGRRLVTVLLTISLMANAILIAVAVAGARENDGILTLAGALRTTTDSRGSLRAVRPFEHDERWSIASQAPLSGARQVEEQLEGSERDERRGRAEDPRTS